MRPSRPPELAARFERQRAAYARDPAPPLAIRLSRLDRLRALLDTHEAALVQAIDADFGGRSAHETRLAELFVVRSGLRHARAHLRQWMRERRVPTAAHFRPGYNRIAPQPRGVVGVMAPWNYPLQLALGPAVAALAAGNRVLVKPSDLTPRLSALLESLVADAFDVDELAVVTGDVDTAKAFARLPFDHLFFTGSTAVGRDVAQAAAANLTPVTLELGGKSPAVIGPHARFDYAVDSLLLGKTLNAGQTCVAPDYVLVPRGREDAFVARARARIAKLYPDFAHNRDYTTIISERHYARLQRLADEAQAAGAQLHALADTPSDAASRRFAPTAVTGAPDHVALMQEEIFGPLLPVVPYDTIDDAIRYINARPRPLALYLYDDDAATVERVTRETIAGGMAVNETLMHLACESLPFGGVGASGMGAYHGYDGFVTFSKMKPVFTQARLNTRNLVAPPYGKVFDRLIKTMLRF